MRPLLFLVADKNMEHALRGFFERAGWPMAASCGQFDLDVTRDIVVAAGQHDPGLYTRANELLRQFQGKYEHVVVMMDAAWDGSPEPAAIREKLEGHIISAGWARDKGLALVLCPEVDVWLWSDSPHAASAMGWQSWNQLRSALEREGWLEPKTTKPRQPKEAAEWALRQKRKPRSSALYRKVAGQVSVRRCQDEALETLLSALRQWFPLEGP